MSKRRIVTVCIPVIVILGIGFWAYQWWHQPASSTVNTTPLATNSVLGSATTLVPWQTAYFSTQIPNTMRPRTTTETGGTGSYLLSDTSQRNSDQVGVTVALLGNNSLSEVPGVKLRLNQPQTYTQTSRNYAPVGAYVFTRSDSYEVDIFWQHNGRYAAVSVSGAPARSGGLEQTQAAIINNWQWK